MATYIGVDGGGTKTPLLVQRNDEPPRYFEFDQTIRFVENGYEEASKRFIALLREIDIVALDDIACIAIGLAGASIEGEQRRFEQSIKSLLPGMTAVHVRGDASLSLSAGFGEHQGLVLIAGTGSVAIGRTEDGQLVRVGGWGRLLGDEGSGHTIGLAALRHCVRSFDGRDEGKSLFLAISRILEARFATETLAIRTLLAQGAFDPAELAPLVFDHLTDPFALEILEAAADDLAELVKTCAQLIHYRGVVKSIGSVIHNEVMSAKVGERIASSGLTISRLDPQAPVEYALRLARAAA